MAAEAHDPRNRAYVAEILKTFGLSINDTKGIIDISKGLSLINFATPDGFKNLDSCAKTRGTAYGVSFESVCCEVMGSVQARQLRHLIGFPFHRHPKLNLPEYRLQAIEKHMQSRVQQLLRLQTEHKKQVTKRGGPER